MRYRINPLTFAQVWEADTGQGAGSDPTPPADDAPALPPDAARGLNRLLERHSNDAGAVSVLLYDENRQYREKIRQLQEQLPPDSAVILTDPAEIDAWNQRGDLAAQLEQAQQQIAAHERAQAIHSAAQAAGYNERVLSGLISQIAEPAALETAERDGQTVATIRIGAEADPIPLTDYAAQHWADYMPALRPETRPTGTPYPTQAGSNGQAPQGGSLADQYIERMQRRAAAANPLRPAAQKES